jgi:hypothetical protein
VELKGIGSTPLRCRRDDGIRDDSIMWRTKGRANPLERTKPGSPETKPFRQVLRRRGDWLLYLAGPGEAEIRGYGAPDLERVEYESNLHHRH